MSAVVLRCPNCGTTQPSAGECEACHEAAVRPFCTNHTPGRWLDGPRCDACGAQLGVDAPRRPTPAPTAGARPADARAAGRDAPLAPGPRAPAPRAPEPPRTRRREIPIDVTDDYPPARGADPRAVDPRTVDPRAVDRPDFDPPDVTDLDAWPPRRRGRAPLEFPGFPGFPGFPTGRRRRGPEFRIEVPPGLPTAVRVGGSVVGCFGRLIVALLALLALVLAFFSGMFG